MLNFGPRAWCWRSSFIRTGAGRRRRRSSRSEERRVGKEGRSRWSAGGGKEKRTRGVGGVCRIGGRCFCLFFFFSSRRRHTRCGRDWSSDVCSSDLARAGRRGGGGPGA